MTVPTVRDWEAELEKKILNQVADSTDLVIYTDCTCGVGEPRGDQCDCAYECHHKGYVARVWLKDFIKPLLAAAKAEGYEKGKEDVVTFLEDNFRYAFGIESLKDENQDDWRRVIAILEAARSLTDVKEKSGS